MTNKEISALLALATANFPHISEKDMKPTALLWKEMLSDIPFEVAKAALIKVLATAKYWPTVAEIREAATSLTNPDILPAPEAWAQVMKAIRYNWSVDKLDPIVRKAIEGFGGLDGIGYCENIDVVRGQFMKAYEQYASREKEMVVLPSSVRELVGRAMQQLPGTIDVNHGRGKLDN